MTALLFFVEPSSLRAQGEQLPLRFATSTGTSPLTKGLSRCRASSPLRSSAFWCLRRRYSSASLSRTTWASRLAPRHIQLPPGEAADIGHIVTGMLGLLAFSLALALSMAQSRFDTRRAAALQEANAIGTAWLRAHAIGHERSPAIARLLEDYIRLRIEYVRAGPDQTGLSAISQRTSDMQGVMWGHATAIARERPDPASMYASLKSRAFDASTAQRWGFR